MSRGAGVIASEVPAPYSRNPDHIEFGDRKMDVVTAQVFDAEPGGIEESIGVFKANEEKRSAGLLNLAGVGTIDGKPAKLFAPRPAYVHQEYPRMLYHADGRDMVVDDAEEHEIMKDAGFRNRPYEKPQI